MEEHVYHLYRQREDSWWWGVGRRALIRSLCRRYGSTGSWPRILEVGCGTGAMLVELERLGAAYGLDIAPLAARYCRERGVDSVCLGDAQALPYGDGRFDLVVTVDLLEHLDDDLAALREMLRVCCRGGLFIGTVPAFQFLWSGRDVQLHHRRRYTLAEVSAKLAEAGFRILKISYVNLLFFPIVFLLLHTGRFSASGHNLAMDYALVPPLANRLVSRLVEYEAWLLTRMNLPFGTSIVWVARRPVRTVGRQQLSESV
jgi:SAM-dependent methyltransferase